MIRSAFFVALIIVVVGLSGFAESPTTNPSALNSQPRLFAPGVVSSPDYEFNTSFTPDGDTVYFSKSDVAFNRITIVYSQRKNGRWSQPRVAGFSGFWKDTDPFVSPDGKRLFFSSTRPADGGTAPRQDYDIWYVDLTSAGVWGEPHNLGSPVNTTDNELYPSVTRDGTLYFCASRRGVPGLHLYRSARVNGQYGNPEPLPFSSQATDLDGTVAADESFIVFISRDRGGVGAGDIFVSFRHTGGSWSMPKNLGAPINSASQEIATGLSPDNRTLYFASSRTDLPARTAPVNYAQLEDELHGIQNGLLNIYEADISDIKRLDTADKDISGSASAAQGEPAADYYLMPALKTGQRLSNIFSRAISYQMDGYEDVVRRVSGTATYTVKELTGTTSTLSVAYRYDGLPAGANEVEIKDGGKTACYQGKCSATTDASGLLYNPLLWGEMHAPIHVGSTWDITISEPWELGPAGTETVTVVSLDPGSHTVTLKREGSGGGYFDRDQKQIKLQKDGKTFTVDVDPGLSHWIGYTIFQQGIVVSDELLVERPVTLHSTETGMIPAKERQYILLNAMPNPDKM